MPILPQERIHELHAAAIETGLAGVRYALLSGIDPSFAATLPDSSSAGAQLLSDLYRLNQVARLRDGSVPFLVWLSNAAVLTAHWPEAKVFEAARAEVEVALSRDEAPSSPPPSSPRYRSPTLETRGHETRGYAPSVRAGENRRAARVVVWYADADRALAEALFVHLDRFEHEGRIVVWSVDRLPSGAVVIDETRAALKAAHVVVVLVSAEYLASPGYTDDLPEAIAQQKRLIPLLARPCLLAGTPFEGMTILPEGKRALLGHPARESAYVAIVETILAAADSALKLGDLGASARRTPDARPAEALPKPLVKTRMDQVFAIKGVPKHTFIPPSQLDDIVWHLGNMGHPLLVEGPTQSGKSTMLKKALEDPRVSGRPATWIQCRQGDTAADEIQQLLRRIAALTGYVIIEDAHLLLDRTRFDERALRALGDALKVLLDVDEPQGKIVVLGINPVHESLAGTMPDLAGRMDVILMRTQPKELIRALVERGQAAANVEFTAMEEIVVHSLGSFRLAQGICYQLASDGRGPALREVPSERIVIAASPDTVRATVVNELRGALQAPLVKVASADRDTTHPGACLALLSALAAAPDMTVPIGEVWSHYPHLDASFRWVQEGHLAGVIARDITIAELLSFKAGALSAHDPRLQYYLQGISWKEFAKLAGPFNVTEVPGERLGISPLPKAEPGETIRTFQWTSETGIALYEQLVAAYDDLRTAKYFLATVPVDLSLVADGAIGPFWTDALNAAAKQAKLMALVGKALADPLIAAYHPYIRRAALSLGLLSEPKPGS